MRAFDHAGHAPGSSVWCPGNRESCNHEGPDHGPHSRRPTGRKLGEERHNGSYEPTQRAAFCLYPPPRLKRLLTSEEASKEDLEETGVGYVREFELKTSQATMKAKSR